MDFWKDRKARVGLMAVTVAMVTGQTPAMAQEPPTVRDEAEMQAVREPLREAAWELDAQRVRQLREGGGIDPTVIGAMQRACAAFGADERITVAVSHPDAGAPGKVRTRSAASLCAEADIEAAYLMKGEERERLLCRASEQAVARLRFDPSDRDAAAAGAIAGCIGLSACPSGDRRSFLGACTRGLELLDRSLEHWLGRSDVASIISAAQMVREAASAVACAPEVGPVLARIVRPGRAADVGGDLAADWAEATRPLGEATSLDPEDPVVGLIVGRVRSLVQVVVDAGLLDRTVAAARVRLRTAIGRVALAAVDAQMVQERCDEPEGCDERAVEAALGAACLASSTGVDAPEVLTNADTALHDYVSARWEQINGGEDGPTMALERLTAVCQPTTFVSAVRWFVLRRLQGGGKQTAPALLDSLLAEPDDARRVKTCSLNLGGPFEELLYGTAQMPAVEDFTADCSQQHARDTRGKEDAP
ncbi:MAG: hypothetical protein AMXMBFR64_27730 [Myxococcales bacterium]